MKKKPFFPFKSSKSLRFEDSNLSANLRDNAISHLTIPLLTPADSLEDKQLDLK